jgi:hypothetical protein
MPFPATHSEFLSGGRSSCHVSWAIFTQTLRTVAAVDRAFDLSSSCSVGVAGFDVASGGDDRTSVVLVELEESRRDVDDVRNGRSG